MNGSTLALPNDVTFPRVEAVHRRLLQFQANRHQAYADRGWKIANMERAGREVNLLLLALEKAAEVMEKEREKQMGQTQRRGSIDYAMKVHPTEVQVWREAYRMLDRGTPLRNFEWIYGAAAELAGFWP